MATSDARSYCPECNEVVAPHDDEAVERTTGRFHGWCDRKRRFRATREIEELNARASVTNQILDLLRKQARYTRPLPATFRR